MTRAWDVVISLFSSLSGAESFAPIHSFVVRIVVTTGAKVNDSGITSCPLFILSCACTDKLTGETMKTLQILLICLLLSPTLHAAEALTSLPSPYTPEQTLNRLETDISNRGLTVFARIDHAAGAASIGQTLRPTTVLIFGNPRGGTPLMQCEQTLGIDLPLRMLVWEDASGQVWLSYTEPAVLADRRDAQDCPALGNLGGVLEALAQNATKSPG